MRKDADNSRRENQNTHFMFNNFFFENRSLYGIILKNTAEPDRLQMRVLCMLIACWIPKATNTRSQYVALIAFPLQPWSHKGAPMLRHTVTVCLVKSIISWNHKNHNIRKKHCP